MWFEEKDQLVDITQLRLRPCSRVIRVKRKVSKDSLVAFDRSRYSMPPEYIKRLAVSISQLSQESTED